MKLDLKSSGVLRNVGW